MVLDIGHNLLNSELSGMKDDIGSIPILKLLPETDFETISIEKNVTPQELVISESGFYQMRAENNTSSGALAVGLYNTSGNALYVEIINQATQYTQISTPILYLNAGTYLYRAGGGIVELRHYTQSVP